MKKHLVSLLALLLVLTGCSNANAEISNKKDVVISVGNETVTNDDLYYMLMYSEYGSIDTIMSQLEEAIYDEIVPINDDVMAKAQKIVDDYKESYGDYYEFFMSYSGYANEEEFLNKAAIPNVRYVEMASQYIDLKFSTLSVTNKPRKIEAASFKTEEEANAALEAANSGKSIKEAAEANNGTALNKGEAFVVTSSATSALDADALNVVCGTAVNGVIVSVLPGSDKNYYVVNMVEANPENFKEEAIEAIANTVDYYEDAMRYNLKERNFKITDTYTNKLFTAEYPDFIFD